MEPQSKMKSKFIYVLAIVINVLFLAGCQTTVLDQGDLPIEPLHAVYAIDMADEQAVVKQADYVFVAKVKTRGEVEYDEENFPSTVYQVDILHNLKGKLKREEKIIKSGGISREGDKLMLFEHDRLPQKEKLYLFIAYKQTDGGVIVSGANSTLAIEASNNATIKDDKTYQLYDKAVRKTGIH